MNISYATQTDVKPPTFVFFVSNTKGIHFSYERYLTNQIRETLGFDSVSLKLVFRKKGDPANKLLKSTIKKLTVQHIFLYSRRFLKG